MQQDEEDHKQHCSNYLLLLECDMFEAKNGVIQDLPYPSDVDERYTKLPEKLITLLNSQLSGATCSNPKIVTLVSERLSYPLSLMYAIESIPLGSQKKYLGDLEQLFIHVVGATSYTELMGIIKWEYFAHRLPKLKLLYITFVGPDLFSCEEPSDIPDDHILDDTGTTMCDTCRSSGRKIVYEMVNMTYHEYFTKDFYRSADVKVAFNCGFHEFDVNKSWLQSLPLLVADSSIPLVFTSYTKREAEKDLDCLKKAVGSLAVDLQPQLNPFHSLRPYRDLHTDNNPPIFFWNHYIACVRRGQ